MKHCEQTICTSEFALNYRLEPIFFSRVFTQFMLRAPEQWQQIYTLADVERCLSFITTVSAGETMVSTNFSSII